MAVEYHIQAGIASMVGLAFVLRLSLVLGGLGFASVFAVALLGGGIYLIATGHPSGGYALAGASVLAGIVAMALVLVAVVKLNKRCIGRD